MKKFAICALFLLTLCRVSLAHVSEIEVQGVLLSYDKQTNTAVIRTETGNAVVPVTSLPNLTGYITGKAFVVARVEPNDFARLNMKKK